QGQRLSRSVTGKCNRVRWCRGRDRRRVAPPAGLVRRALSSAARCALGSADRFGRSVWPTSGQAPPTGDAFELDPDDRAGLQAMFAILRILVAYRLEYIARWLREDSRAAMQPQPGELGPVLAP